MRSPRIRRCAPAACLAAAFTLIPPLGGSALHAQGRTDYFNVESPQVSPITLASVNGLTVLVVCNTPDNSIELWDTNEDILAENRFIQRLWVGLEPVSVAFDATTNEFYTANFLSDSVTRGVIEANGASVRARLLNTVNVGDEPMDIAVSAGATRTLFVTLNSSSAIAWLDAATLAPVSAGFPYNHLVLGGASPTGLKEPHAVRVQGGRVYALGFKGGVTDPLSRHDLDVLSAPIAAPLTFDRAVPPALGNTESLGSSNFNMRFATNGDLYAVGAEAQNFNNNDKIALRNLATGFVTSMAYRVTNPGTATPIVFSRDLNTTGGGAAISNLAPGSGSPTAQPTDLALLESGGAVTKLYVAAFGSDRIAVLQPPVSVAVNPDVATWTRTVINLGAPVSGNPRRGPRGLVLGNGTSGPRLYVLCRLDNSIEIINTTNDTVAGAFALSRDPTPQYIRTGREFLYSADISGSGQVSCSSCHPDARTDALSWKLGNPAAIGPFEPPPSAGFIIGLAGTGSFPELCDPNQNPPLTFQSDPDYQISMLINSTFDPEGVDDKREMVTQSLQGLLNFEVPPAGMPLVTNAPYHWRGDKQSFVNFNEAFVTLMLAPDIGPTGDPQGITPAQMAQYEEFINSVNYPPNPQQPLDRVPSPSNGTFAGGALGLQQFYEAPTILNNRSCSHCHAGTEGSNNRLTVFFPDTPITGFVTTANRQPIESAAMRGLLQKEPLLERSVSGPLPYVAQAAGAPQPAGFYWDVGNQPPSGAPVIGHFGMNHNGIQPLTQATLTTINTFVDLFFAGATTTTNARAVKQYCHEFDWGVAPIVGLTTLVNQAVLANPTAASAAGVQIVRMLNQAHLANASVVAWLNAPNSATPVRGFRYLPQVQSGGGFGSWYEEPTGAITGLGSLTPLVTTATDTLIFVATPLGSERRVAFHDPATPTSTPLPATAPPTLYNLIPQSLRLLTLRPNSGHTAIPTFVNNWAPLGAPGAAPGSTPLQFAMPNTNGGAVGQCGPILVDEVFAKTLRIYQYGLLDGQNGTSTYGLPTLRHEAPRRIRLTGSGIHTGASLRLEIPNPPAGYGNGSTPGNPSPLQSSVNQGTGGPIIPLLTIDLPLHPTNQIDAGSGLPIWETAVEVDPLVAYQLMLGWLGAPGVAQTVTDVIISQYAGIAPAIPEPTAGTPPFASLPFDPNNWNWHRIQVINPAPGGGTNASAVSWQQLRM